ncbi:hypothetical protein LRS56_30135 [Pseudomonas poae]|nr:hypothetical protein LRS56_30135 [Pseudomonas poae]
MERELTTKRFLRGRLAMVEFCSDCDAFLAFGLWVETAESPVLEPLEKLIQWCLMAFSGYAKVDPNNLLYRRCTSSQKEWGAFDITGQATLGLYALFADFIVVRAADARRRH